MGMLLRLSLMLTAFLILAFIIFGLLRAGGGNELATSAYGTANAEFCGDPPCLHANETECRKDVTSGCDYRAGIESRLKKFIRDFFSSCKDRNISCDTDFSIEGLIKLAIKIAITVTISVTISTAIAVTISSQLVQKIKFEPIVVKVPPVEVRISEKESNTPKPTPPAPPPPLPQPLWTWVLLVPLLIFLLFFLFLAYNN